MKNDWMGRCICGCMDGCIVEDGVAKWSGENAAVVGLHHSSCKPSCGD